MKAKRFVKITLLIILALFALLAMMGTIYVAIVASGAKLDESKLHRQSRATLVLDAEGNRMGGSVGYTPLEDISPDLINAFVAVEDKRFFQHHGLDYRRMAGALLHNIKSMSLKEGASTITCQLIKNTHLTQEKTLERKIKEAKLALELEKIYSKEQILEAYLNVIYLGTGTYGVNQASHSLFGKAPNELSLTECAAIAATTVNPARYSPRLAPEANAERRNMVLSLMLAQGYIDEATCEKAKAKRLTLIQSQNDIYETYRINAFDEAVRLSGVDAKALRDGYTILTYCSPTAQEQAYDAIYRTRAAEGADKMVLLCDNTAGIIGFCSNFGTPQSLIRRQIGSTIKPFIYASAIEKGLLLPDTILSDEPETFGDYTPHNYHDIYRGAISARDALAYSSNVVAARTLSYAGIEDTFALLNDLGLPLHQKDKHLGLALGGLTYGNTMDELATAYATLQNGGVRRNAAFVKEIRALDGSVVYRRETNEKRVLRAATAYLLQDMMQQTVREGTAKKLGELGLPLSAKTGTVESGDANSDAWCVAFCPARLGIAWIGNLSMAKDKMVASSGGGDAANLIKKTFGNTKSVPFSVPSTVTKVEIDDYRYRHDHVLELATANTPKRYRKLILCPQCHTLQYSALFDSVPNVDAANIAKDCDCVRLSLNTCELRSYVITYDNGFQKYTVDVLSGTGGVQQKEYTSASGWWCIKPILHGNIDIEGVEYRALVY